MSTIWDRVRRLEGSALSTLYRPKSFTIVAVEDDCVRIVPADGIGTERRIRRDRIEYIAGLGLPKEELRRRIVREFPTSLNTSYIAAIAHAASGHVGATSVTSAPVGRT